MTTRKLPGDVVMACVVPGPAGLVLPDVGVGTVLDAVAAWQQDGLDAFVAAVNDLLVTALTLGEDPAAPAGGHPAARTLLAVLSLLQPLVAAVPGAQAQMLQQQLEAAGSRFKGFAGEQERVTRVLDSGARPAGTTAASPLARFALLGKVPPKRTDG